MKHINHRGIAYVVFPLLVFLLVSSFFVRLQPAEVWITTAAAVLVSPLVILTIAFDLQRYLERKRGTQVRYATIPRTAWFSLLVILPVTLYLSQIFALTVADLLVGFDPGGSVSGLRLVALDVALKGALFDFMESYELSVSRFDPIQNVLAFQTIVFVSRLLWAAWLGAVIYHLASSLTYSRFWKRLFGVGRGKSRRQHLSPKD